MRLEEGSIAGLTLPDHFLRPLLVRDVRYHNHYSSAPGGPWPWLVHHPIPARLGHSRLWRKSQFVGDPLARQRPVEAGLDLRPARGQQVGHPAADNCGGIQSEDLRIRLIGEHEFVVVVDDDQPDVRRLP